MGWLNLFKRGKKAEHQINESLLESVSQYIDAHYEGYSYRDAYHIDEAKPLPTKSDSAPKVKYSINPLYSEEDTLEPEIDSFDDIFKIFDKRKEEAKGEEISQRSDKQLARIKDLLQERGHEETFSEHMLRIISNKGLRETDVYHSVFMDRKLFNKIRNDPNYQPSKRTALQIVIALKLSVPEAQELLEKAGYALSHCSKTDLIVECCIRQGVYDIFDINDMLDSFGMPPLMKCD